MDQSLRTKLMAIAQAEDHSDDPSHDFSHILRVLKHAEVIAAAEGGDMDILVPAALFHDVINYPKNDPRALNASNESAEWTAELLRTIPEYPQAKIPAVQDAIAKCSFTKGIIPDLLESKILQDADGLESTGAISIMRTFASSGKMKRPFFHPDDPFSEGREPDPRQSALDLFFFRLLKVKDRMHTATARKMAERRHQFLHTFLNEVRQELGE